MDDYAKKISKGMKKMPDEKEQLRRKHISEARKGHEVTEETRKKMSEAAKKRYKTMS